MKLSRQTILSAVALMLMLWAPTAALAIPINGTFSIAGLSDANVFAMALQFLCVNSTPLAPCPGPPPAPNAYGNFTTTAGTGSFAPYAGQGGYNESITQATAPLNQPFTLSKISSIFWDVRLSGKNVKRYWPPPSDSMARS